MWAEVATLPDGPYQRNILIRLEMFPFCPFLSSYFLFLISISARAFHVLIRRRQRANPNPSNTHTKLIDLKLIQSEILSISIGINQKFNRFQSESIRKIHSFQIQFYFESIKLELIHLKSIQSI